MFPNLAQFTIGSGSGCYGRIPFEQHFCYIGASLSRGGQGVRVVCMVGVVGVIGLVILIVDRGWVLVGLVGQEG